MGTERKFISFTRRVESESILKAAICQEPRREVIRCKLQKHSLNLVHHDVETICRKKSMQNFKKMQKKIRNFARGENNHSKIGPTYNALT